MQTFSSETIPHHTIERVDASDMTPDRVQEIADFYRYTFANAFEQYLFYPSQMEPIGVDQVPAFEQYGPSATNYVPLQALDAFDPADFPLHPQTGERAQFWHHPDVTRDHFHQKLARGHVALLRDDETGLIKGFSLGHQNTVRGLFSAEEWKNPVHYSGVELEGSYRSFAEHLETINRFLVEQRDLFHGILADQAIMRPDDQVYGWNTVATDPSTRGLKVVLEILRHFFDLIPQNLKDSLINLGEARKGDTSLAMFQVAGARPIEGYLSPQPQAQDGDSVFLVHPLARFAETFSLSARDFTRQYIAWKRAQKSLR